LLGLARDQRKEPARCEEDADELAQGAGRYPNVEVNHLALLHVYGKRGLEHPMAIPAALGRTGLAKIGCPKLGTKDANTTIITLR
jgi:hypothetical protein